ncbi:flagellar biosynthesis protein [Novosphingobium sp. YJ-S2-02]|uniref:Flagellar biosynthesis protein n=1 Tax=Novosphingobium aureum TaxID=2792964 RepID=A0A931MJL4_9SPHN|nr:FliH/SctL family protein [Novosphingobium aureum]MBH0111937.1 flagellar biosynthesis protein [Novosphingobium aureum]
MSDSEDRRSGVGDRRRQPRAGVGAIAWPAAPERSVHTADGEGAAFEDAASNGTTPDDGAAGPIQPFSFDRVFQSGQREPAEVAEVAATRLREEIAALEARVERMAQDHAAELSRARSDGFEAGLVQARSEREEAVLAATDALHAALEEARRDFDRVSEDIARDAAVVAYQAANMLAGHAVDHDPVRAIDEALGRALDQVSRGTGLVIRINPAIREDLEKRVALRQAREQRRIDMMLVEDETIAIGDAQITWTEGGLVVDAMARRAAVLAELGGLLGPDGEAQLPGDAYPGGGA